MDKLIAQLGHQTWIAWVLFLIASGLVAAILSQVGAWLVALLQGRSQARLQRDQQDYQERSQLSERENQSLQLLIAAHFQHREKCLEDVVNVREWLWEMHYKLYGPDHDYYGDNNPPASIKTISDALGALNRTAYYHPSRSIRSKARSLGGSIGGHFNRVNDEYTAVGGDPTEEQLDKWEDSADEIIELIHTPPTLDEVRHPTGTTST